jgi:hypothetical protein
VSVWTLWRWEQLPAEVLGNLFCKPSNFMKRVRKVINKAKLREGSAKGSELWLKLGKDS